MNKMRQALVGMTIGLSVVLVSFASVPAANAVVLYDESGMGDLSAASNDPNFDLQLGLNQVFGSWAQTPSTTNGDGFQVTLVAGLQIDSISIAFSLTNGDVVNLGLNFNPGNLFDSGFTGCTDFFNCPSGVSASFMDNIGPTTGPLDTTLAASTWGFELVGGTIQAFSGINWTVNITTSEFGEAPRVPEPSTLALFGIGLAGLGFMTRRRRNRRGQN